MVNNHEAFLDSFFEEIQKVGLDIEGLDLDHIAYQASSSAEYDALKPELIKLGQEVSEQVIRGRRVAVYRLFEPLNYKHYRILAMELIEPKPDQNYESGFQHAEFVVRDSFETYLEKYPDIDWDTSSLTNDEFAHLKINFPNGLTLKFLQAPILELVEGK